MTFPDELSYLSQRLRTHVAALAASPRIPGSRAHRQARAYIHSSLEQAGFAVRRHTYRATLGETGCACENICTEPVLSRAAELPWVIIGAHYDTVPDSPGADDNASAVAALIELAHWLQPRLQTFTPRARLQLIAFDLEEYGMLGSSLRCGELVNQGDAVHAMVSLEMLGFASAEPGSQYLPAGLGGLYPNVANFIGIVGNQTSAALLHQATLAMKTVPALPVESLTVPGNGELLPETRLSDHAPFWDAGFNALMITDTSFFRNPHYHQPTDAPDTLDYGFLAKVTAGVCAAVLGLLGGPLPHFARGE